jgi:hypothetical protein
MYKHNGIAGNHRRDEDVAVVTSICSTELLHRRFNGLKLD